MQTDPEDVPLPRGVALAWGVAAHPQRGPRRELSLERIVEAAIDIADAEGLGAVSMSAVAGSLGFTTMSLYRYVTNKDELLLVMADAAFGIPSSTVVEGDGWRERLGACYREQVAMHTAHPWLLDVPLEGTPTTPGNMSWLEAGLATLEDTNLEWLEKVAIALMFTGYARWTANVERGYETRADADGVTPDDLDRTTERILDTLVTPEQYPHVRAALDSGFLTGPGDPFAFGLERMLDGVAQYVESRASGQQPQVPPEPVATHGFPKDPKVREARAKRREAERAVREADRRLGEAVKREREAVSRAREKAERTAG